MKEKRKCAVCAKPLGAFVSPYRHQCLAAVPHLYLCVPPVQCVAAVISFLCVADVRDRAPNRASPRCVPRSTFFGQAGACTCSCTRTCTCLSFVRACAYVLTCQRMCVHCVYSLTRLPRGPLPLPRGVTHARIPTPPGKTIANLNLLLHQVDELAHAQYVVPRGRPLRPGFYR